MEFLNLKIRYPEQFQKSTQPAFESDLYILPKSKDLGIVALAEIVVALFFSKKVFQRNGKPAHLIQIETAFKALKSIGFNIKDTHLAEFRCIEKLLAIVLIAILWVYKTGIYIYQKIKLIRILKHGNKAKSLFKYGLD